MTAAEGDNEARATGGALPSEIDISHGIAALEVDGVIERASACGIREHPRLSAARANTVHVASCVCIVGVGRMSWTRRL